MANNEQKTIRRGTTPTINYTSAQNIKTLNFELCIDNNGYQIIRTTKDKTLENDGFKLSCILTQEETLALKPNTKALLQLRIITSAGIPTAIDIEQALVTDVLRNGKITK